MKQLLKKIRQVFKPVSKIETEVTPQSQLQETLKNTLELKGWLDECVQDPVNRLYILSTYTTSFGDLQDNVLNKQLTRRLVAVNLYAYFKKNKNIELTLERMIQLLEQGNKFPPAIEHDLYEICDSFEFLRSQ